jgi:hypothetical protein
MPDAFRESDQSRADFSDGTSERPSLTARLRALAAGSFLLAMLAASGQYGHWTPAALAAPPPLINMGHHCFNVVSFGADPYGIQDSTAAFRAAFSSANIANGVSVCAPSGTYVIGGDITMYSNTGFSTQGGPSFFGAGSGLTVLTNSTSGSPYTGPIFDSCPSNSNVTPNFAIPAACMPVTSPSPASNNRAQLQGTVLSGFSIVRSTLSTADDFYFPEITSLLIDDVCTVNSKDVFDLGDQIGSSSWGAVVIRDSTCGYNFTGHFIATHGGGGNLIVANNHLNANATGVVFDTSDMTDAALRASGSAGNMSWIDNTVDQPYIGMFLMVEAGPTPMGTYMPTGPGVQDSQWKGNSYHDCILLCYYLGADAGAAAPLPDFGHITMADRDVTSRYSAVYMNGGFYTGSGGVEDIQIGGPSSYTGSSGGTASSVLLVEGSPAPQNGLYIFWPSGSSTYATSATATTSTITANLAGMIAPPSPAAHALTLANPTFGLIGLRLLAPPPRGTFNSFPILVATSGLLSAVGLSPSTSCPTLPSGFPISFCYSASFDVGDAVAIRNAAHDIDVVGATLVSQNGAAIHVWSPAGDQFHFLSNVLGQNGAISSYSGISLDTSTPTPRDYFIAGNELAGATYGIVNAWPTPAFHATAAPAARTNHGAVGLIFGPTTQMSPDIQNVGPFDCAYYFDWSAATVTSITLAYPGGTSSPTLGVPPPNTIDIPVGAELKVITSMGTVTYTGFCQP